MLGKSREKLFFAQLCYIVIAEVHYNVHERIENGFIFRYCPGFYSKWSLKRVRQHAIFLAREALIPSSDWSLLLGRATSETGP
jgi:hypothetical protein